jgi:hypothetical protein
VLDGLFDSAFTGLWDAIGRTLQETPSCSVECERDVTGDYLSMKWGVKLEGRADADHRHCRT